MPGCCAARFLAPMAWPDEWKRVTLAECPRLGHSNLATTQVYARMVDERMRASIRALDYGMGTVPKPAETAKLNEAM